MQPHHYHIIIIVLVVVCVFMYEYIKKLKARNKYCAGRLCNPVIERNISIAVRPTCEHEYCLRNLPIDDSIRKIYGRTEILVCQHCGVVHPDHRVATKQGV